MPDHEYFMTRTAIPRLRRMRGLTGVPEYVEEMKLEVRKMEELLEKETYDKIAEPTLPVFDDYHEIIRDPSRLDNAAFNRLYKMYDALGMDIDDKKKAVTLANYKTLVADAYFYIKSINCVIPDQKEYLNNLNVYYNEVYKDAWNKHVNGMGHRDIMNLEGNGSKYYAFLHQWNGGSLDVNDNEKLSALKDIEIENVGTLESLGFDKLAEIYTKVKANDRFDSEGEMKECFDILKNKIMSPLCMSFAMREIDEHTMSPQLFIDKMEEVFTFMMDLRTALEYPCYRNEPYKKLGTKELSEIYGNFRLVAAPTDYQSDPAFEARKEEREKQEKDEAIISAQYARNADYENWSKLVDRALRRESSHRRLQRVLPFYTQREIVNTVCRLQQEKTKEFVNEDDRNFSFGFLYDYVLKPLHMTRGLTVEELFPEKSSQEYISKVNEVYSFLTSLDMRQDSDGISLNDQTLLSEYKRLLKTNPEFDKNRKELPVIPENYEEELKTLEESMKVWNSENKDSLFDINFLKLALGVNQRIRDNGFEDTDDMEQCFKFLHDEILLPLGISEEIPHELMTAQVYTEKLSEAWGILELMQAEHGKRLVDGAEVEATQISDVEPYIERFEMTHNIPDHRQNKEFLTNVEAEQDKLAEKTKQKLKGKEELMREKGDVEGAAKVSIDGLRRVLKDKLAESNGLAYMIPDDPAEQIKQFDQMFENFRSDGENTLEILAGFSKNMKLLLDDYNKLLHGEDAKDVLSHLQDVSEKIYEDPNMTEGMEPIVAIMKVWALTKGYADSISGDNKPRYYKEGEEYGRVQYAKSVFNAEAEEVDKTLEKWSAAKKKVTQKFEAEKEAAKEKAKAVEKEAKKIKEAAELQKEKIEETENRIKTLKEKNQDETVGKVLDFVAETQKYLLELDILVGERYVKYQRDHGEYFDKMDTLRNSGLTRKLKDQKIKETVKNQAIKINALQSYIGDKIGELQICEREFKKKLLADKNAKKAFEELSGDPKKEYDDCIANINAKIKELNDEYYTNLADQRKTLQTEDKLKDEMDAFRAINDLTLNSPHNRHAKIFNAITKAIIDYNNGLDMDNNLTVLYKNCREYLNIHTENGATSSVDGQNYLEGRLRKQAVIKLLEVMQSKESYLPEFKNARDKYEDHYRKVKNKDCPKLNFDMLKESLARKSKGVAAPDDNMKNFVNEKAYAELKVAVDQYRKITKQRRTSFDNGSLQRINPEMEKEKNNVSPRRNSIL